MGSSLEDAEFLLSSDHRVGVLEQLLDGACDRRDLRSATGASPPTIGRIIGDFEDRHWIERNGRFYRLTGLGTFVAERVADFQGAMATERRLRRVWPWLPHELEGFDVELVLDAVISFPGPQYPYQPVERDEELIADADDIRGFGMTMLKSSTLEEYFARILDGMECEYVYPTPVFETIHAWDSSTIREAIGRDNYTVYVNDDVPTGEWCGICLTDDRVSICCYEPDSGMLRALVDTDADAAYTWGESVYERYRAEARPVEAEELDALESTDRDGLDTPDAIEDRPA